MNDQGLLEKGARLQVVNWPLIGKCISDGKWLFLSCAVALFAMCWVRAWAVSMVSMKSFQLILDNLPKQFQDLFPVDAAWLVTYTGRVALAYEEPIIFLCLAIWCLARSSDCVSGQLGRGTMEMLLAQPVSRLQVLLTHSAVTVVGIAFLSLASWLGLMGAVQTSTVKEEVRSSVRIPYTKIEVPVGEPKEIETPLAAKVNQGVYWHGTLNFFCTGMMLAGLTTFLSSLDRYRWRTLGIATGFYIVQTLIVVVGAISPKFAWIGWFSIMSNYKPSVCILNADQHPELFWNVYKINADSGALGVEPLGYNVVLISFALVAYIAAATVFQRRDLPAPV